MATLTTPVSLSSADADYLNGLITDAAGDLFGMSRSNGDDTVFEIAKTSTGYARTPTVLATFSGDAGYGPQPGLLVDTAGDLFGTTVYGGVNGAGTVFEIAKTSTDYASAPTVLVSFNYYVDGSYPQAGLIADAAGNLFGTTYNGPYNGESWASGTVFEIAKTSTGYASTPTVLASFNSADGSGPQATLTTDAAGDLFGTTIYGGAYSDGVVFEIAKTSTGYASTPTVLVSFNGADGGFPVAGVIVDAAEDLFGTTEEGGADDNGTVFEIAKTSAGYASTPTVLASFNNADGREPVVGLITDASGNLFGMTSAGGPNNAGEAFELSDAGFKVTLPASGIDLASLDYKSSYEAVWTLATNVLQILDTANFDAVVDTLSIAGTLTGGLFTLSSDSSTGTEVSFAPNALVSVATGDLVVSNISAHFYSAYERIYSNGTLLGTDYFGIASPPYTSEAVLDGTNGEPESASFSNGMTETWTYNPDGSYQTAFAGVTGTNYTSKTVQYAADGRAENASFSNGMAETWTYNPDGSYQAAYAGVTGAPFTSETVQYGANGRAESATFSNGMTEAWTYNPDSSYQIAFAGVTGTNYTSKTVQYAADGRAENASFSNGMAEAWTYNPDGSYQAAYAGVTGAPFTSETVQYGANGRAESASFSNGMTETWTYNPDGSYQVAYAGVTGAPYTSKTEQYGANGRPESALFSNGMTEIWTFESDGSYEAAFAGVTGASYTALEDSYSSSAELETSLTTNTNGAYTLTGHQDGLRLEATKPNETLIGGGADETFLFATPFGHDTLGDFASHLTGPGADTLSLPGGAFGDSFALLLAATTFSSSAATITVDPNDTIRIPGLTETAMAANSGDFTFHA